MILLVSMGNTKPLIYYLRMRDCEQSTSYLCIYTYVLCKSLKIDY